jgi:aldehyde:ferredoxin oxidoreductase
MAELCGWAGLVLWVDLTSGKINKIPTAEYEPEKFVGGLGLNTKVFWIRGCPKIAAFDPENPLLVSVGPLTGVVGPFSRGTISSISPQSYPEELFSYSSFGGKWPAQLKYAGYDGLVVTGKASKPVYLSIEDADIQINDATHLWGVDTWATGEALLSKDMKAESLCIGPAAENLSRIAPVMTRTGNTAGQGGFGAVMGAKNLKAIRLKGTGAIRIARPDELLRLIKLMAEEKSVGGSDLMPDLRKPLVGNPARDELVKKYRTRFSGCYGCPYQCMATYKVPKLGTGAASCAQWVYGAYDHEDAESIWEANVLMQKLGFENYSIEAILSFLYLCRKEGILTENDFQGLGIPLCKFLGGKATGHEVLTSLLYAMAEGRSIFSNGLPRAIKHFNKEAFQIYRSLYTAHGYSIHHHETVGGALHWALDTRDTSPSAADEMAFMFAPHVAQYFGVVGGESTRNQPDNTTYQGNERNVAFSVKHQMLRNSLTWCEWHSGPTSFFKPPEMDIRTLESKVFSAVTGVDKDVEEIWKAGEAIWNLRRAVMVKRENRTRNEDTIDDVHFEQETNIATTLPLDFKFGYGVRRGGPLDRDEFEAMKSRYYELGGWDVNTGRPTRAKLEELGLKDVAYELAGAGKSVQ